MLTMPKPTPLKLPKDHKLQIIRQIQHYMETELDHELGDLAADHMLEFFLAAAGPYLYNQGIQDARVLISERIVAMEEDLYALEKPIRLADRS
jgi:uncharacterized protein (DUF2164 family)